MHLLIVDDERNIRDSIRDYIPWSELGILSADAACNGKDALRRAKARRPDILLTDVRMPKMDGIKLADAVKEMYPGCKIIFLSGYADKEYLKSAINLNAIDYIEKPVDMDEIKTVVGRAVALHQQEIARRNEMIQIQNQLYESMPLIRQELAQLLVQDNCPATQKLIKLSHYSIRISESGWYTPLYVILNWRENTEQSPIKERLINACNEEYFHDKTLCGFDDACNLIIIAGIKISKPNHAFIRSLTNILGADAAYTYSVGLGRAVHELALIPSSFREAADLARMQFYMGTNRIFCEEKYSPVALDDALYAHFAEALKNGDHERANAIVEQITRDLMRGRDQDISHVRNIYFNLLMLLFERARDKELIDTFGSDEKCYVWKEIGRFVTISELSKYLTSNIKEVTIEKKSGLSLRACRIMKYIDDHFSENDLTLQAIAENVYLSQTYLCAFFKKSTGKTLNQYLTEVRMEKAKELLRDNGIKIYEIAQLVGFTDTNYFSSLFKKHTGCTPSEYKEQG